MDQEQYAFGCPAEFQKQRQFTVIQEGQTYWGLKDACRILGLKVSSCRIPKDEGKNFRIDVPSTVDQKTGTPQFRRRSMYFITTDPLLELISQSAKPYAEEYRAWIILQRLPITGKNDPPTLVRLASAINCNHDMIGDILRRLAHLEADVYDTKDIEVRITRTTKIIGPDLNMERNTPVEQTDF